MHEILRRAQDDKCSLTSLLEHARNTEAAMDFEVTYSEEQERFRAEVRAWMEANVPRDIARTVRDPEDSATRYRQQRGLGRTLGEQGWLYPLAPVQYGGGGLSVDQTIILEEEADRFDIS